MESCRIAFLAVKSLRLACSKAEIALCYCFIMAGSIFFDCRMPFASPEFLNHGAEMILNFKIGFSIVCLLFSSTAWAASCDSDCQLKQITSYFSALDKISRKGSSVADIDALLALTHDDVNYIHVAYEANFTKSAWRAAFIKNLNRHAYQNGMENKIKITKVIFGQNHAAIEYSHVVTQPNGQWEPTEPLLVLFAFTDGKISLVKELW
jgi:hypothetical protein